MWVLYPKLGLEATLEIFEELGLRYLEYPYELFRDFEPEGVRARVSEVAGIAESFNLVPYQLHAEYGDVCFELASLDEGVRSSAFARIARWVEYAAELGVKVLVVHAAFPKPLLEASYDKVVERIVEIDVAYLRDLSRVGEDHGVVIAVENCVEPWFCSSPADLLLLMERVSSDHVGVCLDTGHLNVNGLDVASAVRVLASHMVATHLHDNDGRRDLHLPPLSGCIDWRGVMKAFSESGYKGPLIYEFSSPEGQSARNAVEVIKLVTWYLRGLV